MFKLIKKWGPLTGPVTQASYDQFLPTLRLWQQQFTGSLAVDHFGQSQLLERLTLVSIIGGVPCCIHKTVSIRWNWYVVWFQWFYVSRMTFNNADNPSHSQLSSAFHRPGILVSICNCSLSHHFSFTLFIDSKNRLCLHWRHRFCAALDTHWPHTWTTMYHFCMLKVTIDWNCAIEAQETKKKYKSFSTTACEVDILKCTMQRIFDSRHGWLDSFADIFCLHFPEDQLVFQKWDFLKRKLPVQNSFLIFLWQFVSESEFELMDVFIDYSAGHFIWKPSILGI